MNLIADLRKSAPSIITELNLISGVISIILAFNNQVTLACIFILLAAFFDLFDGAVARLLNVVSDFGKQIDSIADVVSFGVAPSAILLQYINNYVYPLKILKGSSLGIEITDVAYIALALVPAIFASLRLARYNITISKTNHFQGMPVPSSAMLFLGLWLFQLKYEVLFFGTPYFIILITLLIGFLMVSKINMLSLKLKGNTRLANSIVLLLIVCSIIAVFAFKLAAIFIILLIYIFLSVLFHVISKINMSK